MIGDDDNSAILIVEDDTARLAQYSGIVADLGKPVQSASSAPEAIRILDQGGVAAVLAAVSPDSEEGREMLDWMRRRSHAEFVPVVFLMSREAHLALPFDDRRMGLVDWMEVPVNPDHLCARLRILLDLQGRARTLEQWEQDFEQRIEERERVRRKENEEFRIMADLLDMAGEGIVVRSFGDGAIQYWNAGAEQLYGWQRTDVIGRDLHDVLQTVFPQSRAVVEHALIAAGGWQGKVVQRTSDGREIIVSCRKTLSRDHSAVLEVCRDVTLELKTEDALRESEKLAAMGRVAGTIAHEINNPLAAITNLFYLLQMNGSLDDEARGYAVAIERELERVAQITRQTLGFYRESREPVPIVLHELLDDVLELQKPLLLSAEIAVQKRYAHVGRVRGFPGELRQVFLNLVSNAIQAMPSGGTLRVAVHDAVDRSGRRGSAVSVIDTGGGIRKEDVKKLFQPFFSTKATKGTGLGLWISKGILEKYRGHIRYRSYRKGEQAFTCFRVFIPEGGGDAMQAAPMPASGSAMSTTVAS